MRKTVSFLLALFLFLTLTACGESVKPSSEITESTEVFASQPEPEKSLETLPEEEVSEFVWEPAEDAVVVSATDPVGSILMDNDFCTVKITEMIPFVESDSGGDYFAYVLSCENKSDKKFFFHASNLAVNGYSLFLDEITLDGMEPVESGDTQPLIVWSYYPVFDSALTSFDVFKTIEFTLDAYAAAEDGGDVIIIDEGEEPPEFLSVSANVIIYPQGDTAQTVDFTNDRAPVPGELVLIDDNNIKMTATWFGLDEDIFGNGAFTGYTSIIYIENKTDKTLSFGMVDIKIDGHRCDNFTSVVVPGKHRLELWKDGFSDERGTGITKADKLEFKLDVQFHKNNGSTEPFEGYESQTFTVTSW